jgi:hypothetical protein
METPPNRWSQKMPLTGNTPQMFDWIFFAIILLPTAYLVWDWFKNR